MRMKLMVSSSGHAAAEEAAVPKPTSTAAALKAAKAERQKAPHGAWQWMIIYIELLRHTLPGVNCPDNREL